MGFKRAKLLLGITESRTGDASRSQGSCPGAHCAAAFPCRGFHFGTTWMWGRKKASRRAFSPAHRPAASCPGVPAQLRPRGQAPTKPWLPQEESGEAPGVSRHFSLNGIDYFCNQHLAAETEHPLLQDSKTKITQGRGTRYNSEAVLLPSRARWVSAI